MELALPPSWMARLPTDRALMADDVLRLPEGPPFFELVDGAVIVSPPPIPAHAIVAGNLFLVLHAACPPHFRVFSNPVDWVADERNVLEPDLTVVRHENIGPKRLSGPPILAVEILSPSTRRRDIQVKREVYERGGVDAYWLVDPKGPGLVILERDPHLGTYIERADLTGEGAFDATIPFPVTIDLARLLD